MKKTIIPISFIIILSIILWGSVSLSGDFVSSITIPIQITNTPDNYTLGNITHKEVTIRLKGKGWELARVGLAGGEDFLVSANKKIGKIRANLRNHVEINPWLTSSFQILDISPAIVEYEIDKMITKKVNIKHNGLIEFRSGFGFASAIELTPNEVEISGPASLLQNIDTVKTDSLKLNNIAEDVNVDIKLAHIDHATFNQNVFKLSFTVQKIVDKSFDELPVEIRNVPSTKGLSLFPSKVNVVLRGGINILGRITNDSIKVYIDFWSVMRSEDDVVEPIIEIPSYTTIVDVRPKKLEYVIKQY